MSWVSGGDMRDARDLRLYFRALADPRRLRMVGEISAAGEITVKDLCQCLGGAKPLSQPLVSWHLRVLVRCGLVKTRRQGRLVYCTLNRGAFTLYQSRLWQLLDNPAEEDADAAGARRSAESPGEAGGERPAMRPARA